MLEITAIYLVFAVLFAVIGLPVALLLRKPNEGWTAALADSLTYGLVFITVGITLWTWIGILGAALSAGVWVWIIVEVSRSKRQLPTASTSLLRSWPTTITWIAILVVAIALRLHSVNFLPWVGDMGAYVNWANEFAQSGVLSASWPPLFPVFLSMSSFAFGIGNTASAVGLSGIILIVAIARLLQRLNVHALIVIGAAALVCLQPTAVWFSTFPVSESLDAPIFTVWLMAIHSTLSAHGRRLWYTLGVQTILMLALCLLRGSGSLLMIPLVIVLVAALAVRSWRTAAPRMILIVSANLVGAGVGFWYGVTVIRPYLVEMQIKGLVPRAIADILDRLGLLSATPALGVALVIPAIALTWIGVRWNRTAARHSTNDITMGGVPERPVIARRGSAPMVLLIGVAVVLTVGVVLGAIVGAMVWFIILRLGVWLIGGAIFATVVAGILPRSLTHQIFVAILSLNIVLFVGLHTIRLGFNRGHDFYRYWDRYLFSEVLPAALILTALAIGVVAPMLTKQWRVVVAVVAAAAIVVPAVGPLTLQSQHTYLGGAYTFLSKLSMTGGDLLTPRLWVDTSSDRLEHFFFVNTWMAFAVPLRRSFGANIVNAKQSDPNFGPDEVLSQSALLDYLACTPHQTIVIYEVQSGGPPINRRLTDNRIALTLLGTTTSSITTLAQPPANDSWTISRVTVETWLATIRAGDASLNGCPVPSER